MGTETAWQLDEGVSASHEAFYAFERYNNIVANGQEDMFGSRFQVVDEER